MDPATLLMLASAGMNIYSSFKGAQDSKQTAEYNANIYRQQAFDTEVSKNLELSRLEREKKAATGTVIANAGLYGGTMSGSPIAVLNRNLTEFEIDKAILKHNYEMKKTYALASAEQTLIEGKAKSKASMLEGVGSLLSAGSSWYGKYGKTTPKVTT